MITVYRIEKAYRWQGLPVNFGPYSQTEFRPRWMYRHNDSKTHPAPRCDLDFPKPYYPDDYRFAFTCMADLLAWFEPEAREWLRENNFRLATYQVDEYTMLTGKYQCAFLEKSAEKIGEKEI